MSGYSTLILETWWTLVRGSAIPCGDKNQSFLHWCNCSKSLYGRPVYRFSYIPLVTVGNCGKTYVGETGRKLGVRLHEHKTEVESKTKWTFTRSHRRASLTEYSKSALTDHVNQANHTLDWKKTTVIDREQDRPTRWIKEVVPVLIRKECNGDEGSYQLSHAYDRFLEATADIRIEVRKNWVPASSGEDVVMRSKRQNKYV